MPLIDYVIPSFNWASKPKFSDGGNTETHYRIGNIRVYLKRPWFSSGEGERLGVVFCMGDINPDLARHFTLWGKDPIFTGGDLNNNNAPTPDDFTFPFSADKDVVSLIPDKKSVPEKVIVFAYNGLYDEERQLYYADIPVNCYKAYFPFIKLALCRYQRHSLRDNAKGTDLCISSVVQTDWIQIVPPRTVTVAIDLAAKNIFTINLRGTSPVMQNAFTANASAPFIKSRIKIIIEELSFTKTDEAFVRIKNKMVNTVAMENNLKFQPNRLLMTKYSSVKKLYLMKNLRDNLIVWSLKNMNYSRLIQCVHS
ncbi:MAG: hypothetical protein IPP73_11185 [Chitinophagaceae bacterium]|nr:hypothetical protein [Chitinophagaceae bacterium]